MLEQVALSCRRNRLLQVLQPILAKHVLAYWRRAAEQQVGAAAALREGDDVANGRCVAEDGHDAVEAWEVVSRGKQAGK